MRKMGMLGKGASTVLRRGCRGCNRLDVEYPGGRLSIVKFQNDPLTDMHVAGAADGRALGCANDRESSCLDVAGIQMGKRRGDDVEKMVTALLLPQQRGSQALGKQ